MNNISLTDVIPNMTKVSVNWAMVGYLSLIATIWIKSDVKWIKRNN